MEVQSTSLIVLFVLVMAYVLSVAQNQFETSMTDTARKCQSTFKICVQQSAHFAAAYNSKRFCDIFKVNETEMVKDVLPFHCLVSNGLCTEDEFDDLAYAACGEPISDFFVSEYETHFYDAIDMTSPSCQDQILNCIYISAVATVLKQEREYCQLLQLSINGITSASCLSQCSSADFLVLKVAACDVKDNDYAETKEGFSDMIILTSAKCQGALENCTDLWKIRNRDYCLATKSSSMCMTESGCSSLEFNFLEHGACEDDDALSSVSSMCNYSISYCVTLSPVAYYIFHWGDRCDLFHVKINDVDAYQCLVEIGFCSIFEYTSLKLAFCDDHETETAISGALLDFALESSSNNCKNNVVRCIMGSIIATLLKSDNQYCDLMKLSTNGRSASDCLNECSVVEKNWFQLFACNTSLSHIAPSPFTKSVLSTSQKCKNTIETCSFGSDLAYASIQSKQYCKLMNIYQSGAETYACLVGSGGCTDSEYQAMTDAACENNE